jgi:hypothetical protein
MKAKMTRKLTVSEIREDMKKHGAARRKLLRALEDYIDKLTPEIIAILGAPEYHESEHEAVYEVYNTLYTNLVLKD